MSIGYIYMFKNKLNNKCYIGKTFNIKRRYKEHISGRVKSNLYNAIVKYGIDNFEFTTLDIIEKDDITELNNELNLLEIKRIAEYNSYNNGYNSTLGGEGTVGAELSDETKENIRIAKLGDKNPCKSELVKIKISASLKEYYKHNPTKKHSDETKEKIRQSKLGDKNPMYGKTGDKNPSYGVDWTKNISEEKLNEFKKKRRNATTGDKNPMYGKIGAMKNKKYPKLLWIDENNNIHEMSIIGKKRHHPNWKLYLTDENNGDKAAEN